MEFSPNPSRRQRHKQEQIATVIKGMQDVMLEVSVERVDDILEADELGFNWQTFMTYLRD